MGKITNSILDYVKLLKEEGLCAESGDLVAVRSKNGYYRTAENIPFATLEDKDIIEVSDDKNGLLSRIFESRPDINVIMLTHPDSICTVAKAGATIYAVLDDMAQIVGRTAKVVPNDEKNIVKGLKRRNSVLIKSNGGINLGRTLNEAFTNVRVLEKAAKVFIWTSPIGKGKKLGLFDAKIMNLVYKLKYSKKNQEQLSQEEM